MRIVIILFSISLMILSCDKVKIYPDQIDSYPTGIGSEWLYDYSGRFYTGSGEEVQFNSEISVKIEKDTVLNDTMNVLAFRAVDSDNEIGETSYMYTDSDGLKNYAYENPGRNVFAIIHPDQYLPAQAFNSSMKKKSTSGDHIYYEPIPRLNIRFPLNADSKWTYLHPSERLDWQIDKEVIGRERISLHGKELLKSKMDICKPKLFGPPGNYRLDLQRRPGEKSDAYKKWNID